MFQSHNDIAKNGSPHDKIRLLTGLGKRLVKGYLRIIKEFRVIADPNPAILLDRGDRTNGSGMILTQSAT